MSAGRPLHPTRSSPAWGDRRHSWADLKRTIRIPQVLAAAGFWPRFRRVGPRWIGPCPIHGGDNPNAFSVHAERNVWFCFSRCGRGGTVLDLALALSGGSWPRMLSWLSRLAVVPVELEEPVGPPAPVARDDRPFRPFRTTLTLDPHHHFFRPMGLRVQTLQYFEAGAWHGWGFLAGTVAVRFRDLAGEPLGYLGRRLDPELIRRLGKWKWPRGFPKGELLYNWHRVTKDLDRRLVVVEGAWSVMKLHQAGITGVVALGGTTVSATQRPLLARARKVVLFLDGDAAGRSATSRLLHQPFHPQLRAVACPTDQDPADLPEDTLRKLLGSDV